MVHGELRAALQNALILGLTKGAVTKMCDRCDCKGRLQEFGAYMKDMEKFAPVWDSPERHSLEDVLKRNPLMPNTRYLERDGIEGRCCKTGFNGSFCGPRLVSEILKDLKGKVKGVCLVCFKGFTKVPEDDSHTPIPDPNNWSFPHYNYFRCKCSC